MTNLKKYNNFFALTSFIIIAGNMFAMDEDQSNKRKLEDIVVSQNKKQKLTPQVDTSINNNNNTFTSNDQELIDAINDLQSLNTAFNERINKRKKNQLTTDCSNQKELDILKEMHTAAKWANNNPRKHTSILHTLNTFSSPLKFTIQPTNSTGDSPLAAAISKDGAFIVAAYSDYNVEIYKLNGFGLERVSLFNCENEAHTFVSEEFVEDDDSYEDITQVAISPDSQKLAITTGMYTTLVYNIKDICQPTLLYNWGPWDHSDDMLPSTILKFINNNILFTGFNFEDNEYFELTDLSKPDKETHIIQRLMDTERPEHSLFFDEKNNSFYCYKDKTICQYDLDVETLTSIDNLDTESDTNEANIQKKINIDKLIKQLPTKDLISNGEITLFTNGSLLAIGLQVIESPKEINPHSFQYNLESAQNIILLIDNESTPTVIGHICFKPHLTDINKRDPFLPHVIFSSNNKALYVTINEILYIYDISDLKNIKLKYKTPVDADGEISLTNINGQEYLYWNNQDNEFALLQDQIPLNNPPLAVIQNLFTKSLLEKLETTNNNNIGNKELILQNPILKKLFSTLSMAMQKNLIDKGVTLK